MFKKVLINLTKERGWERPKLAAVSQAYIAQDSNCEGFCKLIEDEWFLCKSWFMIFNSFCFSFGKTGMNISSNLKKNL